MDDYFETAKEITDGVFRQRRKIFSTWKRDEDWMTKTNGGRLPAELTLGMVKMSTCKGYYRCEKISRYGHYIYFPVNYYRVSLNDVHTLMTFSLQCTLVVK